MKGFDRYIFRQLLIGMILVTAGLTCVIWLTQSLRFIEMIVNRGLSAGKFIYLTILLLPNFLSVILPIALFTVVVFTYSKLISDRELVIMRAAGVSQLTLAKPAILLAVLVVVTGLGLDIFALPQSYRMFRELQWDIRYGYSHVLLQEGAFNIISKDITVYVHERTGNKELLGILVHDSRNEKKPFTLLAERGALVESKKGSRVVMFNGSRQEVNKETNQLSILYFDRYIVDLDAPTGDKMKRAREPRERTLEELFDVRNDTTLAPRQYGKYIVEAHKRLTMPLSSLGYTLIALACLISGNFSRRTQYHRLITAVLVMIAFQLSALGLSNLSARNLVLVPLMYVNAALPILFGFIFTVWSPRLRRPARSEGL